MKCCICNSEIGEYGNNPWPVKETGECCDMCNMTVVLQKRIEMLNGKEKTTTT